MIEDTGPLKRLMWRAHTPKWSFAPASGSGAGARGGRFNRPGLKALYLAPEQKTAADEFLQGLIRPYMMVPYRVELNPVADLTDPAFLKDHKIDPGDLGVPWKTVAYIEGGEPVTWRIADKLIGGGFQAALYPSQAAPGGTCLVVWDWTEKSVTVLDPNKDLPRDQRSWKE